MIINVCLAIRIASIALMVKHADSVLINMHLVQMVSVIFVNHSPLFLTKLLTLVLYALFLVQLVRVQSQIAVAV
jgi:hypothetical protein